MENKGYAKFGGGGGCQIRCITVENVEVAYTSSALNEKAGETPYRD